MRTVRIPSTVLARSALSLLCALCLALCACSTVTIGEGAPDHPVGQIIPARLALVHTAGAHGSFAGDADRLSMAEVTGVAGALADEGYDVLLLDSGDTLGGSLAADLTDGEEAVGILNAAGYDALAPGAAELSLGATRLAARAAQSDFSYLSASVATATDEHDVLAAHQTFTLSDGRLVGVFGLSAPTATEGLAPLAAGDFVLASEELASLAQQQVVELREEGCRLVVCLANLGTTAEGAAAAERLAAAVSGIDVLLDVGDGDPRQQSVTDASGEETLVALTPTDLKAVTVACWERGTLSAHTVGPEDAPTANEQVDALVRQSSEELAQWLENPVATCARTLSADAARKGSSELGTLAADALLAEAQRSASKPVDAALLSADTLQASLAKGTVTRGDALAVLPHDATRLCCLEVTGAQLQLALKPLLATKPQASATMPQVAGIVIATQDKSHKDDADAPTQKAAPGKSDGEKTQGKDQPADPRIVSVGDKPFAQDATYVVVTCERLLADGAPFAGLLDATSSLEDLDTSGGLALASYLEEAAKKGTHPALAEP